MCVCACSFFFSFWRTSYSMGNDRCAISFRSIIIWIVSERSPEKKSATLPHSGSSTSLLSERATRPLPPPPDRLSYVEKPWFHNVTREQAIILITEQGTYGNSQDDGYFLLRPSTTNVNSPLALVLWCRDRVYNIPVRKRSDNRYALGSVKVNETSFSSVEEIVTCYMKEELVLYTGGVQTGSTKLTGTPLKWIITKCLIRCKIVLLGKFIQIVYLSESNVIIISTLPNNGTHAVPSLT